MTNIYFILTFLNLKEQNKGNYKTALWIRPSKPITYDFLRGKLNFLVAVFFTIVTLISVAQPQNALCNDSESTLNNSQSESAPHFTTAKNLPSTKQNTDHDQSICHTCHLGHCSFTLTSTLPILSYNETAILNFSLYDFSLSDFKSQVFRPPIS